MKLLHNIYLGIKRRPLKFLGEIFLAYSALWTLIESGSYFFPDINRLLKFAPIPSATCR
jgi:hypothetical protein